MLQDASKTLENSSKVDLSKYDYASLAGTINPKTCWLLRLNYQGIVDPVTKKYVNPENAHNIPGLKPSFSIECIDENGLHRFLDSFVGLPDSNTVLR